MRYEDARYELFAVLVGCIGGNEHHGGCCLLSEIGFCNLGGYLPVNIILYVEVYQSLPE